MSNRLGGAALLFASMGGGLPGALAVGEARLLGIRTADAADFSVGQWVSIGVAEAADVAPPSVGQKAPEVRLRDQHGKMFVLSEALKEKQFVVLAFYPKAFTGG